MEKIILNETPKRTSRSFGINNIHVEKLQIPEVKEFSNIKIESEIEIENKKVEIDLKYDINEKLTNQLKEANQNLYLNINRKCENPIIIEFELEESQNVLVDNIVINAMDNSKADIIIKYKSKENTSGYHNGICNAFIGNGADIKIILVNLLDKHTSNYFIMNNKIEENANLDYIIADFGGVETITNYYSNLQGEKSNNIVKTMYIGKDNQLIDINYISEVYGKRSNIDIEVYGALKDNSKKNFKGTIDFKKGCKKSTGNENEYCMILSKTAGSKALPMLLCGEDDVKGNHSNSAGKIDEDKLYYIMTRGISSEDAKKLIVKAKFSSILEKIEQEETKQEIIKEIDRRLI